MSDTLLGPAVPTTVAAAHSVYSRLAYHHQLTITLPPSSAYHHHQLTITLPPSSAHHHHQLTIIISSPSPYHHHQLTIIISSPSPYHHHQLTIISSPSPYHHHQLTIISSPFGCSPPQYCAAAVCHTHHHCSYTCGSLCGGQQQQHCTVCVTTDYN
jgi:hypothetical protein